MPRPRQFDGDDVLVGAVLEFWRHGYAGCSVDDLLGQLGLARASMYRTFGSKAELYAKSLRRYRVSEGKRFANCVRSDETALDAVEALFEQIVEQSLDPDRPRGCFVVSAATERVPDDPDTSNQVADQLHTLEEMFTAMFEHAVESGQLGSPFASRRWARFIVTAIQGMRVVATARPERDLLTDTAASVVSAVRCAADRSSPSPPAPTDG